MKRIIGICVMVAALFVGGFAQAGEKPRVGLFIASLDTFLTIVADAAMAKAEELGVELLLMDGQYDTVRQTDQVMTYIGDGIDCLIINIVDASAAPAMIQAAADAKIPVIFVNRNPFSTNDIPPNNYVVAPDSLREGGAGMEYAGEVMKGKGNIVILQGTLGHEPARLRTEGVKMVLKEKYPDIKILAEETGDWMRDKGMSVMENLITAYGDQIDAVLANNDEMALGAKLALSASNMNDVLVIGVDGNADAVASIASGNGITASAFQDGKAQGAGSVELAKRILDGETITERVVLLPVDMITKDNVANFKK